VTSEEVKIRTDAFPGLPIDTLSNMAKSELDDKVSYEVTPQPSPIDSHPTMLHTSEQSTPALDSNGSEHKPMLWSAAKEKAAESRSTPNDNRDNTAPISQPRNLQSHHNSIDEERGPSWIPAHIPGCQHPSHHHHHLRDNMHSRSLSSRKATETGVSQPGMCLGLSAALQDKGLTPNASDEAQPMAWWPVPETLDQHWWKESGGNGRACGFGMDEALLLEEEDVLVNM